MKHAYENKAVISSMKQIFWLHWPYYFCSQTKYISGLAEKSENRSFIILMERSKKFESWLSNIQFTFSNSMDLTYSVCVCVCVCLLFYREGLFRLQDVWDIHEENGSTVFCCEY